MACVLNMTWVFSHAGGSGGSQTDKPLKINTFHFHRKEVRRWLYSVSKRPDGDVWNIVDNDVESQHYGRNFKFDFSYISSKEIKDVVKDYVWQNYRVGNKAISTLYKHKSMIIYIYDLIDT